MFRNTVLVTFLNLLGLALSFGVNIVVSSSFGAGYEVDSYTASVSLPNYFITVITGSIGYTIIPVFVKYYSEDSNTGWKIIYSYITGISLFYAFLAILFYVNAIEILKFTALGFSFEQLKYCESLFKLFLPVLIFSGINELIASVFYARKIYSIPLINKIFTPFFTILILLLFKELNIKSLVLANVFGSLVQLLFLVVQVKKISGFHYKPILLFSHPGVKEVFRLILPLLVASLFSKVFPVFDSMVLSTLEEGSISSVGFAFKIHVVFSVLITSIFSVQVIPILSEFVAKGNFILFRNQISFFINNLLFVAIPISIFIIVFGDSIVKILFERGSFKSSDTFSVASCLKIYAFSIPAVAIGGIISQSLYSLHDTKSVMFVGFFETIFYLSVSFLLLSTADFKSVAIAYSLNFNLSVLALSLILRKRVHGGNGRIILIKGLKLFVLAFSLGFFYYQVLEAYRYNYFQLILLMLSFFVIFFQLSKFFHFTEAIVISKKITELRTSLLKKSFTN